MKYIEPFNEMFTTKKVPEDNNFYTKVDNEEYNQLMSKRKRFTQKEKDDIFSILKNTRLTINQPSRLTFFYDPPKRSGEYIPKTPTSKDYVDFSIMVLPDEWYTVKLVDKFTNGYVYYKCDQFEGLKKFLSYIIK